MLNRLTGAEMILVPYGEYEKEVNPRMRQLEKNLRYSTSVAYNLSMCGIMRNKKSSCSCNEAKKVLGPLSIVIMRYLSYTGWTFFYLK